MIYTIYFNVYIVELNIHELWIFVFFTVIFSLTGLIRIFLHIVTHYTSALDVSSIGRPRSLP